jgi:hypothetical protein
LINKLFYWTLNAFLGGKDAYITAYSGRLGCKAQQVTRRDFNLSTLANKKSLRSPVGLYSPTYNDFDCSYTELALS